MENKTQFNDVNRIEIILQVDFHINKLYNIFLQDKKQKYNDKYIIRIVTALYYIF